MVTQLVYVSRLTDQLSAEMLGAIIEHSSISNALLDVSGVLLCQGKQAMQLIEGDESTVDRLFRKIEADARHRDVAIMLKKRVARRLYPEWGMGLVDLNSNAVLNRARLIRLVTDVQAASNTASLNVESRVLLRDFTLQLIVAA